MSNDPLDKLVTDQPMPPAQTHKRREPRLKTPGRKRKGRLAGFAPIGKSFMLGPRQAAIVDKLSKVVGFSQYIRNLLRTDAEENGYTWPDDIKPRELQS